MINFKRYMEQFYGEGIFHEATELQYDETNLQFSQTEKVLLYYLDRDTTLKMGDIVDLLHIPNSTANYVVVKLTKNGYLKREKSAEDRRVIEVTITDKGREANERIMENLQNRFNVIIDRGLEELERKISPEDMAIVKRALKELF
jgi:DNA-binding MarR family transcriptional regulator